MPHRSKLSGFLTTWFALDAILNAACGIGFLFFPSSFYTAIGGSAELDVTPNLIWAVWQQASYFLLAASCMIVAALSRDPVTRRRLAVAVAWPGIVQIVAAIIRGSKGGSKVTPVVVSVVVTVVAMAPFAWYAFIKHEEKTTIGWGNRNLSVRLPGNDSYSDEPGNS